MSDLHQQLTDLSRKVEYLTSIVLKDAVKTDWIDEATGAAMTGYSIPYMRRVVKEGKGNWGMIKWQQAGRVTQYSRKSIERFLKETSTC